MTKYSIKLILWKPNARGQYAIYIRVTINRKVSYKATGHAVSLKMWDEKNERVKEGHPNADLINAHIRTTKNDWEEKLIRTQLKGKDLSASELKESFDLDRHNIFDFVEHLKNKSLGKRSDATISNYTKHLKKLEDFHGSRTLTFEEINADFLQRYETWLLANVNFRGNGKNYIHALWKTLKKFFNAARKEKLITHYPFDDYENPVYITPDKDHLSPGELKLLEKFTDNTRDPVLKETAVYFLFGCYSGLRISDWFAFKPAIHIKGDKIRLRPHKGKNRKNKWVEMIISKPLKRNLERMKLIPLTLREPTLNEKIKLVAGGAGIHKYLTTHSARHTFAVTICLGNKISSETAAELMGINLKTFVENYSTITQEKIDKETAIAWKGLN